jgi:hypothetical protein
VDGSCSSRTTQNEISWHFALPVVSMSNFPWHQEFWGWSKGANMRFKKKEWWAELWIVYTLVSLLVNLCFVVLVDLGFNRPAHQQLPSRLRSKNRWNEWITSLAFSPPNSLLTWMTLHVFLTESSKCMLNLNFPSQVVHRRRRPLTHFFLLLFNSNNQEPSQKIIILADIWSE